MIKKIIDYYNIYDQSSSTKINFNINKDILQNHCFHLKINDIELKPDFKPDGYYRKFEKNNKRNIFKKIKK